MGTEKKVGWMTKQIKNDGYARRSETAKRRIKIGKLDRPLAVAAELARLYRHARRGEIDSLEASRLASILTALRHALEAGEVDARLTVLEERLKQREANGVAWQ
jgi:hypothetical protein